MVYDLGGGNCPLLLPFPADASVFIYIYNILTTPEILRCYSKCGNDRCAIYQDLNVFTACNIWENVRKSFMIYSLGMHFSFGSVFLSPISFRFIFFLQIVSLTELMAGVKAPTKTVQLFQLTCFPLGHKVSKAYGISANREWIHKWSNRLICSVVVNRLLQIFFFGFDFWIQIT